ncbi:RdRP-domain-containing protein [Ascodesmis nigricans]|uniref:RNA-directed RNA polymerase n=1 Tax=Ascodesmis nigricans TaxID=341454 RepID=A0A4S2MLT9_9PEZI|nr:RdRP-domain-containing protein [Ascodesmis nigricans]
MPRGYGQQIHYDHQRGGRADYGRGHRAGRGKPVAPITTFLAATKEEAMIKRTIAEGGRRGTSQVMDRLPPAPAPFSLGPPSSTAMVRVTAAPPLAISAPAKPHRGSQHYGPNNRSSMNPNAPVFQAPNVNFHHSQPHPNSIHWRQRPEIALKLGNLNAGVHIVDIFTALKGHGQVESIEIDTNLRGERKGTARVRMSGVKTAFWETGIINILGLHITIHLAPNTRKFTVPSPVTKNKVYKEKMGFDAFSLDFGFMYQEKQMVVMHTADKTCKVRFEVDLYRKCIRAFFDVHITMEDNSSANSAHPGQEDEGDSQKKVDRLERYKFEIPFTSLDHLFDEVKEEADDERSFIIPLACAPKYYRLLRNWEKSMVPSGEEDDQPNYWSINEVWMRQTGIDSDMMSLRSLPVSLKQKRPVIDIGRWTTLRVRFNLKSLDRQLFTDMEDALNDFNLCIKKVHDYTISMDDSLEPIWPHIERTFAENTNLTEGGGWSNILIAEFEKPKMPWNIQYQLEACISNNILNEYNLTPAFIDELLKYEEKTAVDLLEHIVAQGVRYFDPFDIFKLLKNHKTKRDIKRSALFRDVKDYQSPLRRVTVTPTGMILHSPEVDQTNRVVRAYDRYLDRFIRCSFSDEKNIGRINWSDKRVHNEVFTRVFRTLTQGIEIGDMKFEFLAFGNSQLREHGAWFFASTDDLSANDIRRWMGDFKDIREVARYASRVGQCFSTTRAINGVRVDLDMIPDVERNGCTFTDGVGKLSPYLAQMISWEHRLPQESSCFQFRLGGFKGVLAVDPSIKDQRLVCTRESQRKFPSDHTTLEIIRSSQFCSASLNRQLIIVMSTLGIEDEVFRDRLSNMLRDYEEALVQPKKALEMLTAHIDPNQMTIEIAKLVKEGFFSDREPFVMSLMQLWRAWTSKNLKEKAKIFIDDAAFVLGVVDETATLRGYSNDARQNDVDKLPEIFIQISDPGAVVRLASKGSKTKSVEGENGNRIIVGKCIVARNPSLHPGDVRVVNAVYVESLKHHVDVVVFSQNGDRPVPSMLSGGDLDGDDYVVIWDPEFTDALMNEEPASYSAPPKEKLDREVQVEDIQKFFVQYMKNDRLGMIANCHLAWADTSPDGVKSTQCIQLAQLHSDAVDYPKSGVPAKMPSKLKTKYPHFMKKDADRSYTSSKILGQLYDMVKRVDFVPCYNLDFNPRILNAYEIDNETLEKAWKLKSEYDSDVRRIQAQHEIATEFEIWSTFVMQHAGGRYNDYKFHEDIGRIAAALKQRFRKKVYDVLLTPEEQLEHMGGKSEHQEKILRFVAAMYTVTTWEVLYAKEELWKSQNPGKSLEDPNPKPLKLGKDEAMKMPPISFPWVFSDALIRIARGYDVQYSTIVPEQKPSNIKIEHFHDFAEDAKNHGLEVLDGGDLAELEDDWLCNLDTKAAGDDVVPVSGMVTRDEYLDPLKCLENLGLEILSDDDMDAAELGIGVEGFETKEPAVIDVNVEDYDDEGSSGPGDSDAEPADDDDNYKFGVKKLISQQLPSRSSASGI